jgi:hypothetical protein
VLAQWFWIGEHPVDDVRFVGPDVLARVPALRSDSGVVPVVDRALRQLEIVGEIVHGHEFAFRLACCVHASHVGGGSQKLIRYRLLPVVCGCIPGVLREFGPPKGCPE